MLVIAIKFSVSFWQWNFALSSSSQALHPSFSIFWNLCKYLLNVQVQPDCWSLRLHNWCQIPTEVSLQRWMVWKLQWNASTVSLIKHSFRNWSLFHINICITICHELTWAQVGQAGRTDLLLRWQWGSHRSFCWKQVKELMILPEKVGIKNKFTFSCYSGFMWDIAPEFNALLVFAEHRSLLMSTFKSMT